MAILRNDHATRRFDPVSAINISTAGQGITSYQKAS